MSKPKKLQYNGDSKVLKYLVTCANWFLDNHTVGTLDDVILTDIADGQILKYDSATSKFVNVDESEGGGGSNVTPNPQGQPTDTLTKIGIGETTQTYYTENSQLCSTEGGYVTSNLDTTLVNGDYTLHIIDGQTEFDEDFTYDGSTVTLNLTHDYDTYDIEITSTTAGMTYCNGAWRNIYCDIYSESSGQTIYDLGTSADKISYDNTTSGLNTDDVQGAIDELADEKVDKVAGKGLSTNDFTNTLKDKLDGIEANPSNTATDDLTKIKIDGTTYNVSSLPFQLVVDESDNGINIVYDDSILNGGGN